MTSQTGKQTIAIQLTTYNIQKIESNRTMKLGKLIDYNKRNIFFSKIM